MKKTYIKPETVVVTLDVESIVCTSGEFTNTQLTDQNQIGAREVIRQDIQAPDAWEEW